MKLRRMLILAGVLLAFVADATVKAEQTAGERIRCSQGLCLVPVATLERLVETANAAEHYAGMCGWVKP